MSLGLHRAQKRDGLRAGRSLDQAVVDLDLEAAPLRQRLQRLNAAAIRARDEAVDPLAVHLLDEPPSLGDALVRERALGVFARLAAARARLGAAWGGM